MSSRIILQMATLLGVPMDSSDPVSQVSVNRPGVTIVVASKSVRVAGGIKPLYLSLEPGGELFSLDFMELEEKDLPVLLGEVIGSTVHLKFEITDPEHTSAATTIDRLRAITNAANPQNTTIIYLIANSKRSQRSE